VDFALHDLFNGTPTTVHTRAGFVNAVDATTVGNNVKGYAINFQDAVWNRAHIARTVTQVAADGLEFEVRGAKITADITIEPSPSHLPPDLTHSQITLLGEIYDAQSDYVGAGAYWIESLFYNIHLREGAAAISEGNGVLTTVYGPNLTASILVTPTIHSGTASF
jgi:hypothetical protein